MLKALCLFVVVGVASAATFRGSLPEKTPELAHKEGCYIKDINDVIPFGTSVTPIGQCYRAECGKHMIYYATCGVVSAGPPCYVTEEDLTKPYPYCCPTAACDEALETNRI